MNFATLRAVVLALASLVLGETAQIAGHAVTRSSLFGYSVDGRTLDADEAVVLLAQPAPVALHADLKRGPARTIGGHMTETWTDGAAARRRYEALRRAIGSHRVTRSTARVGGFKTLPASSTVEIRYSVPAGAMVPMIEAAQV